MEINFRIAAEFSRNSLRVDQSASSKYPCLNFVNIYQFNMPSTNIANSYKYIEVLRLLESRARRLTDWQFLALFSGDKNFVN